MSKITALDAISTIATTDVLPIVDISDTTMDASGTTKKLAISQIRDAIGLDTNDAVTFSTISADGVFITSSGGVRARIDASSLDSFRINGRSATSKVRMEMRISTTADTVAAVASYGVLSFDTSGGVVRLKATFPNGTTKVLADDT